MTIQPITPSEAKTRSESLSSKETGVSGERSFCRVLPLLSNSLMLTLLIQRQIREVVKKRYFYGQADRKG